MLLPRTVDVGDTHHQDAAIAVDVLGLQPLYRVLVVRVRSRGGADVFRLVGHRPFRAVRVHARDYVHGAGVQEARDVVAFAVV